MSWEGYKVCPTCRGKTKNRQRCGGIMNDQGKCGRGHFSLVRTGYQCPVMGKTKVECATCDGGARIYSTRVVKSIVMATIDEHGYDHTSEEESEAAMDDDIGIRPDGVDAIDMIDDGSTTAPVEIRDDIAERCATIAKDEGRTVASVVNQLLDMQLLANEIGDVGEYD